MHRRRKPTPAGRRRSLLTRCLWAVGIALPVVLLTLWLAAPALTTRLIRSLLLGPGFRPKAEAMLSTLTGGEAHLSPPHWSDDTVAVGELRVDHAHGWDAEATGLHGSLDFGAIRNGVWRIQDVGADEIRLRPSPVGFAEAPAPGIPAEEPGNALPAFLRRYIPTQVEISGWEVQRFSLDHGGWHLEESRLQAGAWTSGRASLPFKLSGGTLQLPLRLPEQAEPLTLTIDQGTLRLSEGQIQLNDARLRWKESAAATLRGALKFQGRAWQTVAQVRGVPVTEFLSTWWKPRLTGQLKGDLEFSGGQDTATAWKTDAVLENGVLQGLPLLETLAVHTRVERFKRLVLDICQASFRPRGELLEITNIVVQSNGLLRIEGALTSSGPTGVLSGDFLVGVTPEALRWIPGAQNHVFVESNPNGPPGMHWARVHVAGTLDAPQEDLSTRLLGGAGMALLFDAPGQVVTQGAEALLKPVLGEDAAKMPGKVMEGAGGVLEQGVKTGADMLNKVLPVPLPLPMLPGGK